MKHVVLAAAVVGAVLALAASAFAARGSHRALTLTGVVGPGYTISMTKKVVPAGTYVITIKDKSAIHNFHLMGPGVNKLTGLASVGTSKWTVKLKKGTYRFICDPHAAIMKGVLKVS